jgi:monovalent cation:H+ antiporter-2, CPA2 family
MIPVLAAGEMPEFIAPLALIVVVASVVAWASQRIGLVPIVGFLVAGVVIGPNAAGLIDDIEVVEAAAEIGVILLLFVIGIEFSLERLNRIRRLVLGGGSLTVLLATAAVAGLVVAFGGDLSVGIYTGLLVSVSSTAVVLSMLSSTGSSSSPSGQLSVGVLVFEDVAVVAMVLVVPILGTQGGSGAEILQALGVSVGVIVAVLTVATRVMPRVLDAIARTCSTEVFLLAIIAICFGTAYATGLLGVSVSLGAFLAGLMVSESRFGTQALAEVLPLQIIFTAVFFLSVGMLLDPRFLLEQPGLVVLAIAGVLLVKTVTGVVAAAAVGVALPVAVGSSVMRAQIGEFSFVLEQAGRSSGLTPLGLGEAGIQTFLAASVLLMALTPVLAPLGERLGRSLGGLARSRRPERRTPAHDADDAAPVARVLISGWGDGARHLAADLRAVDVPLVVVTLSPDGAAEARSLGHDVVIGDLVKEVVQDEAGLRSSRVVAIADDEPERALAIASVVAEVNPGAVIVVRTLEDVDVHEARQAGVDRLIGGGRATGVLLSEAVRRTLSPDVRPARTVIDVSEVIDVPAVDEGGCAHVQQPAVQLPSSTGCRDCQRVGATDWVHLRMCTACGHVGCCDSSPGRHASAHHAATLHAVMRSMEPGESWLHCFADDLTMHPRVAPEAVT